MANTDNLKPFSKGYDARRGRKPKGAKHLSTIIQEMANSPKFETYLQDISKGYVRYKGPAIRAIVQNMLVKAVAGDKYACEWVAKHGWSKVEPERIEPASNAIQFICNVPIEPDDEP